MSSTPVAVRRGSSSKKRPSCVNWALAALWAALAVSLIALLVNQLWYSGSGIGPGWVLGVLSVILQAITYVFVGRGKPIARDFTVVFLLLAALPLPIVKRLIMERSAWSAAYLGLGFSLKGAAVLLLFTGQARRWFAGHASV